MKLTLEMLTAQSADGSIRRIPLLALPAHDVNTLKKLQTAFNRIDPKIQKLLANTPYTAEVQKKLRGEPVQALTKWMNEAGR